MTTPFRSKALFVALVFAALALYPLGAGSYGIDLVTKIMVFAIFALSLELLVGGTGLVCFGQAGFFGIGAYAAVLLSGQGAAPSVWWLLRKPLCGLTDLAVSQRASANPANTAPDAYVALVGALLIVSAALHCPAVSRRQSEPS